MKLSFPSATLATSISLLLLILIGCQGAPRTASGDFPFAGVKSSAQQASDESDSMPIELPTNRTNAPEFPSDYAWVNSDRPLRIHKELSGRVVVLDFWTYCCINCMHVLPDLAYIEEKYKDDPVAVVGVHSAKFDNEGDKDNILTACHRYEIEHPVIVDQNHRIWSEYGVRAWPTLMVIDPAGRVVGALSGEGNREVLDKIIEALLIEGRQQGTIAAGPPEFQRAGRVPSASGLAFPGKVLSDTDGELLFISDSNHNRIVVSDHDGQVLNIIGSGRVGAGDGDGSFSEAEFNRPQGMAYDAANRILYIADTENHTIRKADFGSETVTTIAGTGAQVYDRSGGGIGTAQGLNSPWDLALDGNTLYIAMAGPHQLWTLDLNTLKTEAWVGSGIENIRDGNGTSSAQLAQPSGLAIHDGWLYFADSEVSAVRRANLKTRDVETLIGSGLFDFGDKVGAFPRSLLQHPLGVAVYDGDIFVADTYNHRVKRLDLDLRESHQLVGTGSGDRATETKAQPSLYEPSGLAVYQNWLYIADTNHDRIVKYNLTTGEWSNFTLRGLQMQETRQMDLTGANTQSLAVKPGEALSLTLSPQLPKGVHLNAEAPIYWTFMAAGNMQEGGLEGDSEPGKLPVKVVLSPDQLAYGKSYVLTLDFAYCTDGNSSLCIPATVVWKLDLTSDPAATNQAELTATIDVML